MSSRRRAPNKRSGSDLFDRTLERRQRLFESDVENLARAIANGLLMRDAATFSRGSDLLRDLVTLAAREATSLAREPIHPLSNGGPSIYG